MTKLIKDREEFEEDYKNEVEKTPKELEENCEALGGIMAIFNMLQKGDK